MLNQTMNYLRLRVVQNRRCSNKRLIAAGYRFKFNDYQEGYEFMLKAQGL